MSSVLIECDNCIAHGIFCQQQTERTFFGFTLADGPSQVFLNGQLALRTHEPIADCPVIKGKLSSQEMTVNIGRQAAATSLLNTIRSNVAKGF